MSGNLFLIEEDLIVTKFELHKYPVSINTDIDSVIVVEFCHKLFTGFVWAVLD